MKLTIQITSTIKSAKLFIRQMETQGYTAVTVSDKYGVHDTHFLLDGEVSADYSVCILPRQAFIGVRPA